MRSHGTLISSQPPQRCKGGGRRGGGAAPGGGRATAPDANRGAARTATTNAKVDQRVIRGLSTQHAARVQKFANTGANAQAVKAAAQHLRTTAETEKKLATAKTPAFQARHREKLNTLNAQAATRFPGL